MRRALLAAVVSLALLAPGRALAGGPDGGNPLADAEAELATAFDAIATADCGMACRALASIRRSAETICSLDPGPPCADAKDKLAKASTRVHTSCPDCPAPTTATAVPPAPPSPVTPGEKASQPVPQSDEAGAPSATTYAASPAPRHGGCASCAVSTERRDPALALVLSALAAFALRRRRADRAR